MRIRTQFIAAMVASVLTGVAATLLVAGAGRREAAAAEFQTRAQFTSHEVAGLLALTLEYARYGEPRAAQQWRQRHQSIDQALRDDEASRDQRRSAALAELRAVSQSLLPLFARLEELPSEGEGFSMRRKEVLLDQMLTSTQAMNDLAYQWYQDASLERLGAERWFQAMAVVAPLVMLLLLITCAVLVRRKVLLPMKRLDQATAAVGGGDLSFRIGSQTQDEFGALSRQFDAMAQAVADSTERTRRSEQQLRAITDNLPALVAYVDRDQRYEFANIRYQEWMGVAPADMVGRTIEQALGSAIADSVRDSLQRALTGQRVQWVRTTRRQGREVNYLVEYIPDVQPDGQVRGCYALTVDITERQQAEARLARSEQRLQDLMNNIPAMVGYFDMQEHCEFANETGLRSLGLSRNDTHRLTLRSALGESAYAQHEPYVREALQGRRARFEGRIPFQGREAHFQAHLIPDRLDGGDQRGFYLMTFDITALKEAQLQQARIERRLRAITDNLPVLISYIDREERYGFANQTFKEWMGQEPQDLLGRRVSDVSSPELYTQRREYLQRALAGERVSFEIDSPMMGRTRSLHATYIPDIQPDGSVAGIYTLSSDVTALKDVQRQLSLLVRYDSLTGLANRYHFNEALPLALARASRSGLALAVMFLDVDRFKSINDTLGHGTGDLVLREFAKRLLGSVRTTDTVARLAGDEFVVILEGLHSDAEPQFVARKIIGQVSRPFDVDGRVLEVTTSVGIAYHAPSAGAVAPADLLAEADSALYEAKGAGRNTFRMAGGPTP